MSLFSGANLEAAKMHIWEIYWGWGVGSMGTQIALKRYLDPFLSEKIFRVAAKLKVLPHTPRAKILALKRL